MLTITKKNYSKQKSWQDFYKEGKSLMDCKIHSSWLPFFKKRIYSNGRFKETNDYIKEEVKIGTLISPKPELVFNAFYTTPLDKVKVVIIGQDPYYKSEEYKDMKVPQAVGLSFSVSKDFKVPPSLVNIFKNQLKYGNITFMPKSGDLTFWAIQGCLMLNSALTVKQENANSHANKWAWMTNEVIRYISFSCDHVIFMLWGNNAYKKKNLIDLDKHDIIASSHPSPLAYTKPMKDCKSFEVTDHFTEANKLLEEYGKEKIIWQVS